MNLAHVDQIAKAVLYEGYMLYPYRPSSVKNRQRWNFGVLCPPAYSDAQGGTEACRMQTECLVQGNARVLLEVKVRFLQLQLRCTSARDAMESRPSGSWQEAVERDISVTVFPLETVVFGPVTQTFELPAETSAEPDSSTGGEIVRGRAAIRGEIEITVQGIRPALLRVRVEVRNTTPFDVHEAVRDDAVLHSLVSAHTILGVRGGEFVSLLEPPEELKEVAAQCRNVGVWPVLVGEPGQRDTMLASPIILYDYPQIAPESAGDLFDGTEIDEILSLRIMTLTDEEKREIRQSDTRANEILERTETLPAEQFMKLHGVLRSLRPLKETTP